MVEKAERGSDVALVSDAGTPGISDPGKRLAKLASWGVPVCSCLRPVCRITAVLVASGLPIDRAYARARQPDSGSIRQGQNSSDRQLPVQGRSSCMRFLRGCKTLREMREILGEACR